MRSIAGVPTSITAFVGRAAWGVERQPTMCHTFDQFERGFGGLHTDSTMSHAVCDFFANGGTQALIVRVTGDYIGGLQSLDRTDIFNILCIPPPIPGQSTPPEIYAKAAAYCRKRRAMLLVDCPPSWDVRAAIAGKDSLGPTGPDTRNAAVYFPRLIETGGTFVPCGAIAGIYASMDARRGVWKSPGGSEAKLTGVTALTVKLTDRENELLNAAGINSIREFPGVGRVVWGARTMDGSGEWKYVPIRRLAVFLEESIDRGTAWTVFEPNDERLWAEIRQLVSAFLHGLFRQGAFEGRTPGETYFVKCGRDTTTQADIDAGIVNIQIGFAPLKPAEFVILKIRQFAGRCEAKA